MSPEALDLHLKKHTRKIYIVQIAIIIASVISAIAFTIAYFQSAELKVYEYSIGDYVFSREDIVYNENIKFGIAGSLFVYLMTIPILFMTAFLRKHESFVINGNYITLYSNITGSKLYINGDCKDSIVWFGYYLEGKTPDGIRITVATSRHNHMHITFSNGHPPLDF